MYAGWTGGRVDWLDGWAGWTGGWVYGCGLAGWVGMWVWADWTGDRVGVGAGWARQHSWAPPLADVASALSTTGTEPFAAVTRPSGFRRRSASATRAFECVVWWLRVMSFGLWCGGSVSCQGVTPACVDPQAVAGRSRGRDRQHAAALSAASPPLPPLCRGVHIYIDMCVCSFIHSVLCMGAVTTHGTMTTKGSVVDSNRALSISRASLRTL